jgi:hypothetical protein
MAGDNSLYAALMEYPTLLDAALVDPYLSSLLGSGSGDHALTSTPEPGGLAVTLAALTVLSRWRLFKRS